MVTTALPLLIGTAAPPSRATTWPPTLSVKVTAPWAIVAGENLSLTVTIIVTPRPALTGFGGTRIVVRVASEVVPVPLSAMSCPVPSRTAFRLLSDEKKETRKRVRET